MCGGCDRGDRDTSLPNPPTPYCRALPTITPQTLAKKLWFWVYECRESFWAAAEPVAGREQGVEELGWLQQHEMSLGAPGWSCRKRGQRAELGWGLCSSAAGCPRHAAAWGCKRGPGPLQQGEAAEAACCNRLCLTDLWLLCLCQD